MFHRQIFDPALAHYAYLIGCQKTGEAIIIDPQRDIDRYQELAAANDLRIVAVADTHIHADYLTGAREFAADPAVKLYLSSEGGDEWQYEWARDLPNTQLVSDADSFSVGKIEFKVTHTPGHTPEHITFTVTDFGGGAESPIGIASGDFMFVGDVGRPDLLESAAGQAGMMEPSARKLFASLRDFGNVSDEIQIWPAHGAGSACGKALGAVPSSTAGYEKRYNGAYKVAANDGEDAFVDFILADQPEPPLYWARMKMQNRGGFPVLGQLPNPPELDAKAVVEALDEDGTVVVDARADRLAFMDKHLRGSQFAPFGNSFPTVTGSYIPPEKKIVLLIEDLHQLRSLVRMAIRIGLDHIVGYALVDEILCSDAASGALTKLDRTTTAELAGESAAVIVDVRTSAEFNAGHAAGATNIPHTRLADRLDELPDGELAVHCGSGVRAAVASAYLASIGREVTYVDGMVGDLLAAQAPSA